MQDNANKSDLKNKCITLQITTKYQTNFYG